MNIIPGNALQRFGFDNVARVSIDFSLPAWKTVASHEVFEVTGLVKVQVLYLVRETLVSAGAPTISFGYEGALTAYAAAQVHTNLVAGVWVAPGGTVFTINNQTGIFNNAGTGRGADIISGLDLGFNVNVAELTDGEIEAICYWSPVSAGAMVVAGAGGAL